MSSITYLERVKIETFCCLKLSQVVIAHYLKRAPAKISYELARCQLYRVNLAQVDAEHKRVHCGRKTKLTGNLKQVIQDHLRLSWSPETIAHEFKLATKSIYNWLNHGWINFPLSDLFEHGLRHRRKEDMQSKYNQAQ